MIFFSSFIRNGSGYKVVIKDIEDIVEDIVLNNIYILFNIYILKLYIYIYMCVCVCVCVCLYVYIYQSYIHLKQKNTGFHRYMLFRHSINGSDFLDANGSM